MRRAPPWALLVPEMVHIVLSLPALRSVNARLFPEPGAVSTAQAMAQMVMEAVRSSERSFLRSGC